MLEINARTFVVAIAGLRNMETVLKDKISKEVGDGGNTTIADRNFIKRNDC
jgi:hypothetical protein